MLDRSALQSLAIIAAGFAVGALAGCQHQAAEAAAFPDFALHLSDEGDSAKLVYGVANSDVVALMLECDKGSGRIEVSDLARDRGAPRLTLASGGVRDRLAATRQDFEAGPLLIASARADLPAFQAFRQGAPLKVSTGSAAYEIPASADNLDQSARFFGLCAAA